MTKKLNRDGKILIPGISTLLILLVQEIREIDIFGAITNTRRARVFPYVRSGIKGPTYLLNGIIYFINGQEEIN